MEKYIFQFIAQQMRDEREVMVVEQRHEIPAWCMHRNIGRYKAIIIVSCGMLYSLSAAWCVCVQSRYRTWWYSRPIISICLFSFSFFPFCRSCLYTRESGSAHAKRSFGWEHTHSPCIISSSSSSSSWGLRENIIKSMIYICQNRSWNSFWISR